jgi:hypothetical protein
VQLAGRPVEDDVTAAEWLAAAVADISPDTVAALLPQAFAAMARIFHPAIRYAGDDDVEVPWSAVAAANATVTHPLMQWGSVTGSMDFFENDDQAPLWHGAPARGHLPETVAGPLVELLRRHTGTPDECWFGVQDGGVVNSDGPTASIGGRRFWLVRGPVDLAARNLAEEPFEQSANLWWPADRAWVVATDADLVTTYVAGSVACVDAVLADPRLETAPAAPENRLTWDADRVNPLPADGPSHSGHR